MNSKKKKKKKKRAPTASKGDLTFYFTIKYKLHAFIRQVLEAPCPQIGYVFFLVSLIS